MRKRPCVLGVQRAHGTNCVNRDERGDTRYVIIMPERNTISGERAR
jgi:hypothetical protein